MSMGNGYGMRLRPTAFAVESQSTPGKFYHVQLATCECPDFMHRRGSRKSPFCKHLLAGYLMGGWQLPQEWTTGLDSDALVELLRALGVNKHAAAVTVQHARAQGAAGVPVNPDGELATIVYSRADGVFAVVFGAVD